jgi:hypothetical protein
MPRKSAAALAVVAGTIDGRPQPPSDLTECSASARGVAAHGCERGGDVLQDGGTAGCSPASDKSERYYPPPHA